jgi:hypothetical protein
MESGIQQAGGTSALGIPKSLRLRSDQAISQILEENL